MSPAGLTADVSSPTHRLIESYCDVSLVECGPIHGDTALTGIFGMSSTQSSFKSILGLGLLLLAYEHDLLRPGQPVIESTSGSLGVGLAQAGRMLGHPVHLVSDRNIPPMTRRKIELLGAQLHLVDEPDPVGGFQESRDQLLKALLGQNPHFYWTDQNNSRLNPEVYRRWLVPRLRGMLDFDAIDAGIFVVGSGGHFVAIAEMLTAEGIPSYVADRAGSITFGGTAAPSVLRGTGNQNMIPRVIGENMHLVKDVHYVSDAEAAEGVQELARRGIYVGGSSGVCLMGARSLARNATLRRVVTFFPDRGELYGTQFLGESPPC